MSRRVIVHNHFPPKPACDSQAIGMINNRARGLFEKSPGYKAKRPNYNDWGYAPASVRKEFVDEAVRTLKQEGKIDPNWPKASVRDAEKRTFTPEQIESSRKAVETARERVKTAPHGIQNKTAREALAKAEAWLKKVQASQS